MSNKQKLKYFAGVVSTLLLLGAWLGGCFDSNQTKVRYRLSEMRLARLPYSATNIGYHEWSGLFTGETYIKIQTASNDLVLFMNNSPILAESKVELFTPEHQHLPYDSQRIDSNPEHMYFVPRQKFPIWFDLTVTNKGKIYSIWPTERVIINEDTSTVYIHLVKG